MPSVNLSVSLTDVRFSENYSIHHDQESRRTEAAIKIQASFRGYLGRQASEEASFESTVVPVPRRDTMDELDAMQAEADRQAARALEVRDRAVMKLQALYRGHKARERVTELRFDKVI